VFVMMSQDRRYSGPTIVGDAPAAGAGDSCDQAVGVQQFQQASRALAVPTFHARVAGARAQLLADIGVVLTNRKYIGYWPWGENRNVRDPETGKISQEPRSDDECEKWLRPLPHLQLIDDETFDEAQQFLAENAEKNGARRRADGKLNAAETHPTYLRFIQNPASDK
jgi:hypothetical protein